MHTLLLHIHIPDALLAHVDCVLVLVKRHALPVRRDQRVAPRVRRVRAQRGGELGLGAVLQMGASVCWRYNVIIVEAHQHLLAGHGGLVAADRLLDQQLGLGYKVVGDCNTMTQKNAAQNGKYLEEF